MLPAVSPTARPVAAASTKRVASEREKPRQTSSAAFTAMLG
jgi:hypothetical protein